MKTQEKNPYERSGFALFPRSIQQRLPLLIVALLLIVVLLFTVTSYIGMKNTALKLGRERLTSLSLQLSSLFQQSGKAMIGIVLTAAKDGAIKDVLAKDTAPTRANAMQILQKMRMDTLISAIDVIDTQNVSLLHIGKKDLSKTFPIKLLTAQASIGPDYYAFGKLGAIGDSMYFPIVAAVTRRNQNIGYVVCWRKIVSTHEAIEQFSKLLGTKALIFLGNNDGKFWTNMVKPIIAPPIDISKPTQPITYIKNNGDEVIGALQPIGGGVPWLVLVEISRDMVVEGANQFQYWIIMMGILLIIGGSLAGWSMSRHITRPLHSLTKATTEIAKGNYALAVPDDRDDEIGQLARSFKEMVSQVQTQQQQLENKVQQRTAELEASNRELEAFSYSVSHDLRAPLRAVSGYASMLNEDHSEKLDNEGKRILGVIVSNARSMGMLIDDLIAFSRIGRKELTHQPVDMRELAKSSLSSFEAELPQKYTVRVDNLPMCDGDRGLLNQVWLNLIGNAVKYSSKKTAPCIQIGYTGDSQDPVYFVKDNGVGFDMKYSNKLFGVFQRLHSAEEFEGTGIGLALVQRIINKHGGRIWAQGIPGEGATFLFNIPNNTNDHS